MNVWCSNELQMHFLLGSQFFSLLSTQSAACRIQGPTVHAHHSALTLVYKSEFRHIVSRSLVQCAHFGDLLRHIKIAQRGVGVLSQEILAVNNFNNFSEWVTITTLCGLPICELQYYNSIRRSQNKISLKTLTSLKLGRFETWQIAMISECASLPPSRRM